MSATATRAVIYTRISKDQAGDEHGVANQLADCERHAAARGLQVVARLSDNDLSASNGKPRPHYHELMAAAQRREFDVIIVWQTSRLWRNRRERADGIEILRKAEVSVSAAKGPSLDMSTAYGRGMAGLLGEFDTMETEIKGERQRLAAAEAARKGKRWTGCPRPFAYETDHVTPRPAEAEAIRWAADALLGGATVSAVMREWNARGLRTPQRGRPFTRQSVTTILRNPRLAGLNAYRGEITGPGDWQPVLPEATWRAIAALLDDPARKPPRGVRTLLGGLARCQCGNTVIGTVQATGRHAYRCNPATREHHDGPHCQQVAAPVDDYVERVIVERLSRPDVADLITPPATVDAAALRTEAASIRRNLDELAADRVAGLISRSQMIAATERGNHRLAEITAELTASVSAGPLGPFAATESARKVWDPLDNSRKRALIATLCSITVHPAGRGSRVFDPTTISIEWCRG